MTGDAFDAAVVQVFCVLLAQRKLGSFSVPDLAKEAVAITNTLGDALTDDYVKLRQNKERPRA